MTHKYPDTPDKACAHERIAVFAGSFNPFTIGHADIVRRGLKIFDRIIICVGVNAAKPESKALAADRAAQIKKIFSGCQNVEVECWSGITAELARLRGASALLRGVRSVKDFEYERDMADANREMFGVDTVILYSSAQCSWVSSSLVRELQAYGCDVSKLLP